MSEDQNKQEMSEDQKKQLAYEVSRNNLKRGTLADVFATNEIQKQGFGDKGQELLKNHVYEPALDAGISYDTVDENGNKQEVPLTGGSVAEVLRNQRKNGQVGTGAIDEGYIMNVAQENIEKAIPNLYIQDYAEDLGLNPENITKDYQGKRVIDLLPEDPRKDGRDPAYSEMKNFEEQQQYVSKLVNDYKETMVNQRLKQAIDANEEKKKGDLEKMLSGEKE